MPPQLGKRQKATYNDENLHDLENISASKNIPSSKRRINGSFHDQLPPFPIELFWEREEQWWPLDRKTVLHEFSWAERKEEGTCVASWGNQKNKSCKWKRAGFRGSGKQTNMLKSGGETKVSDNKNMQDTKMCEYPSDEVEIEFPCDEHSLVVSERKSTNVSSEIDESDHKNTKNSKSHNLSITFQGILEEEYDNKPTIAFCCFRCDCPDHEKSQDLHAEIIPTVGNFLHRKCCHGLLNGDTANWHSSLYQSMTGMSRANKFNAKMRSIRIGKMGIHAKQADIEESKVVNESFDEDSVNRLYSNKEYTRMNRVFLDMSKSKEPKHPAVVLDIFSGIGGGLFTLKKIGIAIKTAIVVEHDAIAARVCRENNDKGDFVYRHISTFEELVDELDDILHQHGPIDIIMGGPPCQDFALINANRKGVNGQNGKYTPQFGELISRIKSHPFQNGKHVFFLCENVRLADWNDDKVCDNAFTVPSCQIDAKYFSPTKRLRAYYTNVCVRTIPDDESAESSVGDILEDGWRHPAEVFHSAKGVLSTSYKANTFMASKGRLDDERMMKVKLVPGSREKFEVGFYSIRDREVLMGFPQGYVEAKVKHIFQNIHKACTSHDWKHGQSPENLIDLVEFSGVGMHKFATRNDPEPGLVLKYAAPQRGKDGNLLYYFDEEEYSKHLLGNSFSIPVIEHLMSPLKEIFATRSYNDANYQFKWPHNSYE